MNSGSKVLLGVMAGAAAGAILGILFAPEKGPETRRRISTKSSDVAESLKSKFNDLVDNIASKFDSAKAEAADMKDRTTSGIKTGAQNSM